ncbi:MULTISPECIES: Smr/MutS family protein [unclassified Minwuia]|jgi:DNA-nicking Smr family endonuclease|uniref:Smr/MutS family protein n=1 Tax=unclassified Minwuia TaxID=2618799 RepID=UPI00247AC734|nr:MULTISPECIES: Smr/MutS family protein [unclassified Minwuia]
MARVPRRPKGKTGDRDDTDLWQRVAQTVTPLPSTMERLKDLERRRAEAAQPPAGTETAKPVASRGSSRKKSTTPPAATPAPVQPATPRPMTPTEQPSPAARGRVAGLDRRTAERLRKGTFQIDARLDLHGLNREQAHAALRQRVRACHAAGLRCLLVITGKGNRGRTESDSPYFNPEPPGRLKREVPGWLAAGDLAPLVLSTAPAVPRDGGSGALYVLLRRRRDDRRDDSG